MEQTFAELLETYLCLSEEMEYKMHLGENELCVADSRNARRGKRKTGSAYRRYSKYAKYERQKRLSDYIPRFWRVSVAGKWKEGTFIPIGQHIIRPRRSNFMYYLKKEANRSVCRLVVPMQEKGSYQKFYEIEWKEIFHN